MLGVSLSVDVLHAGRANEGPKRPPVHGCIPRVKKLETGESLSERGRFSEFSRVRRLSAQVGVDYCWTRCRCEGTGQLLDRRQFRILKRRGSKPVRGGKNSAFFSG